MEIKKARYWWKRASLRTFVVAPILFQKRIRDLFRGGGAPQEAPSRIALFVSMELLGGGILITAISKTLRQLYPQATIFLVGEQHRAGKLTGFYKAHSCIDEVIICPVRGGSTFRQWVRFYQMLKTYNLDMCILAPNHSCSDSVWLYLLGIPQIVGAYLPKVWERHSWIENKFLTKRLTAVHMAEHPYRLISFPRAYARALTDRLDLELEELVPFIRFEDAGLPIAPKGPLVVMHPGGPPKKRWRPEGYAAIGRKLVQELGAVIFIIGGWPEKELGEQLRKEIVAACPEGQVINCCGAVMNETITYVSRSTMYVGNNAGPIYLAMALGIPIVGVFRGKDRSFSGPDAVGDQHRLVSRENIDEVPVNEVWSTIEGRWREIAASSPQTTEAVSALGNA